MPRKYFPVSSVFIFLVICQYFVSCAAFRSEYKPPESWTSADHLISFYTNNFSRVQSLEAYGILQIESPQINERVPLRVILRAPDSLKAVLEGPLGIDVAQIFLDRDSFLVNLPRDERVYSGNMSELNVQDLLYDLGVGDIDFEGGNVTPGEIHNEILSLFLGRTTLDSQLIDTENIADSTRAATVLKSGLDQADITFEFPVRGADLRRVTITDPSGKKLVEKTYRRYVNSGGVRLPKYVAYLFPQERSRITVRYTNIKVNKRIRPSEFFIKVNKKVLSPTQTNRKRS